MDWQTTIAALIVIAAGTALARRAWEFTRGNKPGGSKASGCGSCPSNSASSRIKNLPLVQLGAPDKPKK